MIRSSPAPARPVARAVRGLAPAALAAVVLAAGGTTAVAVPGRTAAGTATSTTPGRALPPAAVRSDVPAPAARGSRWTMPGVGLFSPHSVFRTSVWAAPVDRRSRREVRDLAAQVARYYNGVAAFNVWQYNGSVVSVPGGQKRVNVLWDDCQGKGSAPAGLLGTGGQFTSVPIPADAVAAAGTDGELTVLSRSTNQLWELWKARRDSRGRWHACWGGRIDRVSRGPGSFSGGFGATATGLPLAGGMVSLADVARGSIDHAVALAIPDPAPWHEISWPARRSDGAPDSTGTIAEGTRFRLPASIDLRALHLTPIGLMVARAAQRYGFVVVDKAASVSVIAESGLGAESRTGTNPWGRRLGTVPSYRVMAGFPWSALQALATDWGQRSTSY